MPSDRKCVVATKATLFYPVVLVFAAMWAAMAWLSISSILDGYWQNGTYGFLVIPCVVLQIAMTPAIFKSTYFGLFGGDALIFVDDDQLHYVRVGQLSVKLLEINSVSTASRTLVVEFQNGVKRFPLALAREKPALILQKTQDLVQRRGDAISAA